MKSTGRKQEKQEKEAEVEEESLEVSPDHQLSGRAKSPLQCAEMVFGSNLMTNLDTLLLSSNRDLESLNNSTLSAAAVLQHKQLEQKQQQQIVSDQSLEVASAIDEMAPQNSSKQPQPWPTVHARAKTTEVINQQDGGNEQSHNAASTKIGESGQNLSQIQHQLTQLRQENMILAAEKSNIQAELIFYKNELAKICLQTGAKFPVFRHHDSISSSLCLTRILAKDSASAATSVNNFHTVDVAQLKNPSQLFYASGPTSEDRYVCVSQGLVEDAASTTMSCVRQSKNAREDILLPLPSQSLYEEADARTDKTTQRTLQLLKNNDNIEQPVDVGGASEAGSVTLLLHSPKVSSRSQACSSFNKDPTDGSKARSPKRSSKKEELDKENTNSRRSLPHAVLTTTTPTASNNSGPRASYQSNPSSTGTVQRITVNLDSILSKRPRLTPVASASVLASSDAAVSRSDSLLGGRRKRSERTNSRRSQISQSRDDEGESVQQLQEDETLEAANIEIAVESSKYKSPEKLKEKCEEMFQMNAADLQIPVNEGIQDGLNIISESVPLESLPVAQSAKSPLHEKEKLLESSHKALQEKLAKVRDEIQLLSADREQALTPRSPVDDRLGATVPAQHPTTPVDQEFSESAETRKQQFEDELQKLRLQLQCFNVEEQKVMRELEDTRTLRKAQDGEESPSQGQDMGSQQCSSEGPLCPLRHHFDTYSQRSTGVMLHSPNVQGGAGGFGSANKPNQVQLLLDLTQESQCQAPRQIVPSESEGLSSYRSAPIEQQDCRSALDQTPQDSQKTDELPTAYPAESDAAISIDINRVEEPRRVALNTGGAAAVGTALWVNQIIEEEHESESNLENSASASHGRCGSNLHLNLKNLGGAACLDFNSSDLWHDIKQGEIGSGLQVLINQHADQGDVKLFNELPSSADSPADSAASARALEKFEKLIQQTQQSDEGCLLAHIQKNLELLKTAGDCSSRFAQLRQQESPSPLKSQREDGGLESAEREAQASVGQSNHKPTLSGASLLSKKYLVSTEDPNTNESMVVGDTERLVQEFQQHQNKQTLNNQPDKVVTGQKPETTQFLATYTNQARVTHLIDYRSSAVDQTGGNFKAASTSCPEPPRNNKSRNAVDITGKNVCQAAPSMNELGDLKIKILRNNPVLIDTLSDTASQNGCTSVELLSRTSPCFQDHCDFELTKQWGATGGERQPAGGTIADAVHGMADVVNYGTSKGNSKCPPPAILKELSFNDHNLHRSIFDQIKGQRASHSSQSHLEEPASGSFVEQQSSLLNIAEAQPCEMGSRSPNEIIDIQNQQATFCIKQKYADGEYSEAQVTEDQQENQEAHHMIEQKSYNSDISNCHNQDHENAPITNLHLPQVVLSNGDRQRVATGQIPQIETQQSTPRPAEMYSDSKSMMTITKPGCCSSTGKLYGISRLPGPASTTPVSNITKCHLRTPKTQIKKQQPARQKSCGSTDAVTANANQQVPPASCQSLQSSGIKTETSRSSFNIYKRNSVRMARGIEEEVDLNTGRLLVYQETPGRQCHERQDSVILSCGDDDGGDISDTQDAHLCAASQSTLDLDQRSNFSHARTPNSIQARFNAGGARGDKILCYGAEDEDSKTERRSTKRPSLNFARNANNVKTTCQMQQLQQQQKHRKYQTSYTDYIDGKEDSEYSHSSSMIKSASAGGLIIRGGTQREKAQSSSLVLGHSSRNQRSRAGFESYRQTSDVVLTGGSGAITSQQNGVKTLTRSMSSLVGAGKLSKPSPSLFKRNQEVTGRNGRNTQSFSGCSGGGVPVVGQHLRNSGSGLTASASERTLVLSHDRKASRGQIAKGTTHSSSSYVVRVGEPTTPNYMQPIQQKFRKQTIAMLQQKEKEELGGGASGAPSAQTSRQMQRLQHQRISIQSSSSVTKL